MSDLLAAARDGRLVAFVGAGLSTLPPTCLPSWWEVNQQVVAALAREVQPVVGRERADGFAAAVARRQQADRFPPEYQAELLAARLGVSYFRVLQCLDSNAPNAAHLRLARLAAAGHLAAVVTTNFDRATEAAFHAVGCPLLVASRSDEFDAAAAEVAEVAVRGGPCRLLKLHGSADDPSTLVDTLAQRKRGLPAGAVACLRLLLRACHWLFLGWSGADLDSDPGYLGLRMAAADGRGFTWLTRTGTDARAVVQHTVDAFGGRARVVHGELPAWLDEVTTPLLPPGPPPEQSSSDVEELRRAASARVIQHTTAWAAELGATDSALCLAELLVAVGEPQAAVELQEETLAALPASSQLRDQAMLAAALAGDLRTLGRLDESMHRYRQALGLVEGAGLTRQAIQVRCNMGLLHLARGDLAEAEQAFTAARDQAAGAGDDRDLGVALHNLALIHGSRGEFDRGAELFGQEIDSLRRLGDEPSEAIARNDLGDLLVTAGRLDEAAAALEVAVRIHDRLGDDRGRAQAQGNLAGIHVRRGDLRRAASIYRETLDVFTRLGDEPNRLTSLGNLGVTALRLGQVADALSMLREALAGETRLERPEGRARRLINLGEALRAAGQPEESASALTEAIAASGRLGWPHGRAEALLELGLLRLQTSDLDAADACFREVLELRIELGQEDGVAAAHTNLGIVAQHRGALQEAADQFVRAAAIDERLGRLAGLVRSRLNLGNVALQAHQLADAEALFANALAEAERLGLDAEAAGAATARAYALGLMGHVQDAMAAFADAEQRVRMPVERAQLVERYVSLADIYRGNGHTELADGFAAAAVRLRRQE